MASSIIKREYPGSLLDWPRFWKLNENEKKEFLEADVWLESTPNLSSFDDEFWEMFKDELTKKNLIFKELPHVSVYRAPSPATPPIVVDGLFILRDVCLPIVISIFASLILKWVKKSREKKDKDISLSLFIKEDSQVKVMEIQGDGNSVVEALREFAKIQKEEKLKREFEDRELSKSDN